MNDLDFQKKGQNHCTSMLKCSEKRVENLVTAYPMHDGARDT
jgi:hypothetical protein